jgi:hypothetical protein
MPARRHSDRCSLDALVRMLRTSSATVLAQVADAWAEIGPSWLVTILTPELEQHLEFLYHFAGHDDHGVRSAAQARTASLAAAQGEALLAYVRAFDDIWFLHQQGMFAAGVEAMPDPWPAGIPSPHRSTDVPPRPRRS